MKQFITARGRPTSLLLLFLLLILALAAAHPVTARPEAPLASRNWDTPLFLDDARPSNDFTMQPVLRSAPNGSLILVYNVYDGNPLSTPQKPYYRLSTDNGRSWSAPQLIHNSTTSMHNVQVAFDNNSMAHAVWTIARGIFYAPRSQWASNGFTEIPSMGQEILDPPSIVVGPDNTVHVAWAQADSSQVRHIYHAHLPPGGFWHVSGALDDRDPLNRLQGGGASPELVVGADGAVHLAWEQTLYDEQTLEPVFEIHYRKGTPGSSSGYNYSWGSKAQILSGTLTKARRPALQLVGNVLHIAFAQSADDVSEPQFAYYRRYPLTGSLGPLVRVNQNGVRVNSANPYFLDPALTVCKDEVYVYFHGATLLETAEQVLGGTTGDNWQLLEEVTEARDRFIFPSLVCHEGSLRLALERIEPEQHGVYYTARTNVVYMPVIRR